MRNGYLKATGIWVLGGLFGKGRVSRQGEDEGGVDRSTKVGDRKDHYGEGELISNNSSLLLLLFA